jgi:anaerobic selenocysteine-containing dehydrogenase
MLAMHQPLQVVGYVATRKDDPERGPKVWMRADDAAARLLQDGELVWIYGPRRQQLAPLALDDQLPRGGVVVRDVVGVAVSELVRIRKPDFDRAEDRRKYV